MIYLSGPMSGYEELNFPEFHRVATDLRNKGFTVISPAEVEQPILTWEACMKNDIKELMNAEKVAVMNGWEKSKGAKIEVELAKNLGMEIICAYTLQPIAI